MHGSRRLELSSKQSPWNARRPQLVIRSGGTNSARRTSRTLVSGTFTVTIPVPTLRFCSPRALDTCMVCSTAFPLSHFTTENGPTQARRIFDGRTRHCHFGTERTHARCHHVPRAWSWNDRLLHACRDTFSCCMLAPSAGPGRSHCSTCMGCCPSTSTVPPTTSLSPSTSTLLFHRGLHGAS